MKVCCREAPDKVDTAFNVTVAENLGTLVRKQGILKTDEGATICRNVVAVEIGGQTGGIISLGI